MAQTIRITSEQQDGDKMQAGNKTQAAGGKVKPSYKHIPHSQKPPHLVAKRNARERRRVQAVNQAFYKLRKSVPIENRNKRVSKVKTLQRAIDYIRRLERILAEDEANGDSSQARTVLPHLQPQADSKLLQEAPLQQNTSQTNLSNYNQNESQQTRNNSKPTATSTSVTTSDEHQTENDSSKATSRPKGRPKRLECVSNETTGTVAKRLQQASGATTTDEQKQKRGKKQTNNKQLTGDLRQNDNQTAIHQLARDQQAQFGAGLEAPHDGNNYGALKSTATSRTETGEPTTISATNTTPTATVYFPSNVGVSYGRPRDTNATSLVAAPADHYPNHHYHYYADSPASSLMGPTAARISTEHTQQANQHHHHHHQQQQQQHQFVYNNHLQLPLDSQHDNMRGEISSSSMSTTNGSSLCECPQANYYYSSPINSNCSPLPLNSDAQSIGSNRLVNHNSFLSPVDSLSLTGQQRYLSPLARQHQYTNSWHVHQQQPAASDELDLCKQTSKQANDKTGHKITRIDMHSSPVETANGVIFSQKHQQHHNQHHQQEYEQKTVTVAAAQSMPADSTSSSGTPRGSFKQKVPHASSIGSPPVSICSSSSSLSPSTTLKSLDLSGGSSSSTSGAMFSATNSNKSDKSPTTTNGTSPVVCRQPIGSNNNSNHDNRTHSTTARAGYGEPQATNGQQQVNNYRNLHSQTYAVAHLSYGDPSNGGNASYHKTNHQRLQHHHHQQQQPPPPPPDEQRPGKLITGDHNKSQSDNMLASLEPQHQNGSRSSSAVSPSPAQQLTLVGGDYLANNNLHGNNAAQLFQQQPTYYDHHHNHHQQHLSQQQYHHHHHQQQQQSQYQGQHFLGNQHNLQQHYSNHLSDHHNHHLQSEPSSSELRQSNVNTMELVTTTNTVRHQQSSLERHGHNGSTTTISPAPPQYTVLPL